jgi:hypothetical protein
MDNNIYYKENNKKYTLVGYILFITKKYDDILKHNLNLDEYCYNINYEYHTPIGLAFHTKNYNVIEFLFQLNVDVNKDCYLMNEPNFNITRNLFDYTIIYFNKYPKLLYYLTKNKNYIIENKEIIDDEYYTSVLNKIDNYERRKNLLLITYSNYKTYNKIYNDKNLMRYIILYL